MVSNKRKTMGQLRRDIERTNAQLEAQKAALEQALAKEAEKMGRWLFANTPLTGVDDLKALSSTVEWKLLLEVFNRTDDTQEVTATGTSPSNEHLNGLPF